MEIARFTFNPFMENTYVVWDDSMQCAVIDAGNSNPSENDSIADFIDKHGLTPVGLFCTHGHFDHLAGVEWLKSRYGIKLHISTLDKEVYEEAHDLGLRYRFNIPPINVDVDIKDADSVKFGNTVLKVIPTPGHSEGHVCFFDEATRTLFSGDLLFRESIGRTDLTGGDYHQIMNSLLSKVLPLGGDVSVYPGHGPKTDIGHEAMYNPFITEFVNDEINPVQDDEL